MRPIDPRIFPRRIDSRRVTDLNFGCLFVLWIRNFGRVLRDRRPRREMFVVKIRRVPRLSVAFARLARRNTH